MVMREVKELLKRVQERVKGPRRMSSNEQGRLMVLALWRLAEGGDPSLLEEFDRDIMEASICDLLDEDIPLSTIREAMDTVADSLISDITPSGISEIADVALDIKDNERIVEVGTGRGDFMRAITHFDHISPERYTGLETDPFRWTYARAVSDLEGNGKPSILLEDAFVHAVRNEGEKYEKVFGNYPLGARLSQKRAVNELCKRIGMEMPQGLSADWAFNILLCSLMTDDGTAVGIMTHGSACNAGDSAIRREFIEKGLISMVVDLPEKTFEDTAVRTSLVVFRKNSGSITLIDASGMVRKGRRGPEPDTERIIEEMKKRGEHSEFSFTVPMEELRETGYVLSAERYKFIAWKESGLIPMRDIIISAGRGTSMKESELSDLYSEEWTDSFYLAPSDIGKSLEELPYIKDPGKDQERYSAEDGDLIVTKTGNPVKAMVAHVPEGKNLLISGNLYIVKLDREKADPSFISHWLMTAGGREAALSVAVGTVQKLLSRSSLDEIRIPGLTLEEQHERMKSYQALEEKADQLRKELRKLEEEQERILSE